MSHNITVRKNRFAEMAYVGEEPWHGLGQRLREGAPMEEWLVAAGMDWKAQRGKVRYATEKSDDGDAYAGLREWPDHHVLFRSDTKAPLGLVSEHFKVVQPRDVLEFFRDLAAHNRYSIETAGTLRGGAVYWALAKINGTLSVLDRRDQVNGYVLLSTACDGTRKTTAKFTSVRVVCNNTLSMADVGGGREVSVSHRSVFDADAAKQELGISGQTLEEFMEQARRLARTKLSDADADDLTSRLITRSSQAELDLMEAAARDAVRESKHFQAVMKLFKDGAGQDLQGASGTAWGWINGVTQYVDHHYPARSQANRLQSAWFGAGETLKARALEVALGAV